MNLLLDTHTFLWWITDSPQLPETARELMANGHNSLYWSAVSSWEVAIKYALGRLPLPDAPERYLPSQLRQNVIESIPIMDAHAFLAGKLPWHHRDPFDRMLVAQAKLETLVLLSNDAQLSPYDVKVIW